MNKEPRDYLREAESMLHIPLPLRELLVENKIEVMEKLYAFLNIENVMQRKSTAYALGQIGDPGAIEQLELRLKVETAEGVRDAIKASIAALRRRSAVDGYSDMDRRLYIADVYSGKIEDKEDVNEYKWKIKEASDLDFEGSKAIKKAQMVRKMDGLANLTAQEEIKSYLERGISLIQKALSIEDPPHPYIYQTLTLAYAELAMISIFNNDLSAGPSPELRILFDKAKSHAEKAKRLYDQYTGWGEGGRHDFHVGTAVVYFWSGEYEKAQAELNDADKFNNETAFYIKEKAMVESALRKLGNVYRQNASGQEKPSVQKKSSGCGAAIVIMLLIVIFILLCLI